MDDVHSDNEKALPLKQRFRVIENIVKINELTYVHYFLYSPTVTITALSPCLRFNETSAYNLTKPLRFNDSKRKSRTF